MKLNIAKPGADIRFCFGTSRGKTCFPGSPILHARSVLPEAATQMRQRQRGFTLLELIAVLTVLGVGAAILTPTLGSTATNSASLACKNNLRRLTAACRLWTDENSGYLLYSGHLTAAPANRPWWVTGNLDFNGNNRSNFDVNYDLAYSPVWPLVGRVSGVFRCPADRSAVWHPNSPYLPRVRSYSMSQVFGEGDWLDKTFTFSQTVWRTYARGSEIALPSRTFLFMDVHPDSINDVAFKNACTGSLPGDPPSAAQLIDYPSPLHNGGCNLSFTDGHAEAHHWQGSKIRNAPVVYNGALQLNVSAETSWVDTQWLAANTTVKR